MELTLTLARVDSSLRDRYVHEREDPGNPWDEQALDAVLNDEEYTTQHRKPFFANPDDPAYVRHEETYYQLGSVIVDGVTETYPVLRLFDAGDSTATPVDASEGGDLPEADQQAVRIAHFAARARGNEGGYPVGLVQRGGYAYRSEATREESELLAEGGLTHVTYRDTTYEIEVTREQFHEAVYRPTAEPVAEDPTQMEAILKATFVGARVTQTDFSTDAQQILTEARADDYSETHPFSEAYRELLRAFNKHPFIDGNIRKDAGVQANEPEMVQYEDTYYDYSLQATDNPNA